MRTRTKNDVAGQEVKLDYESLVTVAEICLGLTVQEIRRGLARLTYPNAPSPTGLQSETERLAEHAHRLALTGELLSTLQAGRSRDTVTIVNRQEVKT